MCLYKHVVFDDAEPHTQRSERHDDRETERAGQQGEGHQDQGSGEDQTLIR